MEQIPFSLYIYLIYLAPLPVIVFLRLMHLRRSHTGLLAILFDFLLAVGVEVRFQVAEMLFDKSSCCTRLLLMLATLLPRRNLFNSSTASSLPNRGIVNILICIVLIISRVSSVTHGLAASSLAALPCFTEDTPT